MISIDDSLKALEAFILASIPLARAMDLRIAGFDGDCLRLDAPLKPNINDKGCAFGGSLSAVMTMACWTLVEATLRRRGDDCDVFVADSNIRYLAPVWGDLHAEARLAPGANWTTFFAMLDARGRARGDFTCVVPGDDGKPAASLEARFVAKRRA